MKIRRSDLGAEEARDAYRARYRRRGGARRPRTSYKDRLQDFNRIWPQDDHAYRAKPNHAARFHALPLFHLGDRKRPVQKECPATTPLTDTGRWRRYKAQNPGRPTTARQRRRMNHKLNRAIGRRIR